MRVIVSLQTFWWAASLCIVCIKIVEDYRLRGAEGGAEGAVTGTTVTLIAIY
jgi:hypothetical protein